MSASGIGSDSVASNDRMDMLDESRLAVLFAGAREQRHDALSSENALKLATIGGGARTGHWHSRSATGSKSARSARLSRPFRYKLSVHRRE